MYLNVNSFHLNEEQSNGLWWGGVAEGWQGGVLFLSKIRYNMGCQANKNKGFTS